MIMPTNISLPGRYYYFDEYTTSTLLYGLTCDEWWKLMTCTETLRMYARTTCLRCVATRRRPWADDDAMHMHHAPTRLPPLMSVFTRLDSCKRVQSVLDCDRISN